MKHIILISLICLATILMAAPISKDMAMQAATNWTHKWAPQDYQTRSFEEIIPISDIDTAQLYIFKYTDGFVLTSADDAAIPILAYGFNTVVDNIQENPAFRDYILCMQQEVKQIVTTRVDNRETSEAWRLILANDFSRNNTRSLLPLLTTRWDQGWPYNMYCPVDAAGPNGHVYAGCVATAMAQVMKYWNWPNTGVGSHSYYADSYGIQSANFGQTTYQWTQMPNSVGAPNEEVGKLLYHLGVSVDMGYSPSGSGAQSYNGVDALIQNFRYNSGIQLLSKEDYSTTTWNQMLKSELDNARPVYYHGFGEGGGHAFVCDGYQGTDYFHFNWGWSGSNDGYFYTGNLNPGYVFNWDQGAMFNVYPSNYNISMAHLALESSNCQVGENVPVSIISYPILPQWNINSASFVMEYDYENMLYSGFETTNTMLDGATINTTILQPGRIAFTVNSATALFGAGTLLKIKFQPFVPGGYGFNLTDFAFNTSPITLITQTTIIVTADITEPQNSVIDLLNAMHVVYNQIATMPITTTFIMPSWNVLTASFTINYPADKVSWEGYDAIGCMSENATITVNSSVPGSLTIDINFPALLMGSGNLIKLQFRATGNTSSVELVTITPVDFYYGSIPVQNLQPGFIVLNPYTANEDELIVHNVVFSIAPNPFSNSTMLSLGQTKQNQNADIEIYNLKGQRVRKIHSGMIKGSKLDLNWDGRDDLRREVLPGVYLIKVQTTNFHKTLKLLKL